MASEGKVMSRKINKFIGSNFGLKHCAWNQRKITIHNITILLYHLKHHHKIWYKDAKQTSFYKQGVSKYVAICKKMCF